MSGAATATVEPDPIRALGRLAATGPGADLFDFVRQLLRALRTHLQLEASFVSQFVDGERVFQVVDAVGPTPVRIGGTDPLEATYCQRVVDGRLPNVLVDASAHPGTQDLPAARELAVGGHISVPISLSTGDVYGTLCCFSSEPAHHLDRRDLAVVELAASMLAVQIETRPEAWANVRGWRERVERQLSLGRISIALQPIVELRSGRVRGYEALARFPGKERPDAWFDAASSLGLAEELELLAMRSALRFRAALGDLWLSLNVSPAVFTGTAFEAMLDGDDLHGVTFEVTEQALIDDYEPLQRRAVELRRHGAHLAVDDVGSGYAGLRHILELAPDVIKLDRSIVAGIRPGGPRSAMVRAIAGFATASGIDVVAEGIESEDERRVLQQQGVTLGQGYLLGRPEVADGGPAVPTG